MTAVKSDFCDVFKMLSDSAVMVLSFANKVVNVQSQKFVRSTYIVRGRYHMLTSPKLAIPPPRNTQISQKESVHKQNRKIFQ